MGLEFSLRETRGGRTCHLDERGHVHEPVDCVYDDERSNHEGVERPIIDLTSRGRGVYHLK